MFLRRLRQLLASTFVATAVSVSLAAPPAYALDTPASVARAEVLLSAVGHNWGSVLDPADLRVVGDRVGVAVPEGAVAADVERVIDAFRHVTLAPVFDRAGVGYGSVVDESDVVVQSDRRGLHVGSWADPGDVVRLARLVSEGAPASQGASGSTVRAGTSPLSVGAGVELRLPAQRVVGAGFHQASSWRAVAQSPLANVMTMSSRGRSTHARSAVDVALPRGEDVLAPVSGTVVRAGSYALYGSTRDELVYIRPDGRSDVTVVVLHVDGLRVRVGQRVEAGVTTIASQARVLPFASQIERYVGRYPHVHIEIRR